MKTTFFYLKSLVVLIPFIFNSCSASPEEAEIQAVNFYEALAKQEYTTIKNMISDDGLAINSWDIWLELLSFKEQLGNQISYTKEPGYQLSFVNEKSAVSFKYIVKYGDFELYEYIRFVKQNDTYKIINYAYYDEEERRQEFIKYTEIL